jgi:lipocalin
MLTKLIITILIFLTISLGNGQDCPNIQVKQEFDVNLYLGKWYEIEKFYLIWAANQRCIEAIYTPIDSTTIGVNNSGLDIRTNEWVNQLGKGLIKDASEPAKLEIEFKVGPITNRGTYWVIDTDYTNYSLVYSCSKILGLKFEYAWILARDRTLDSNVIQQAKNMLKMYNIDISKFLVSDQNNCPDN